MPITRIPRDFLIDKAKLSEVQLKRRYFKVGWDIFHKKRPSDNNGTADGPPDAPGVTIEEFETMFYNLRKMIGDIGKSRIQAIFANKFNTYFPKYTFGGGRKVTCVNDLLEAIVLEPYDDKARRMIHITLNVMWGGNNWAIILEAMIMEVIGLAYTDEFIDPAKNGLEVVVQRNHLGGFIAALLVSRKNRVCNQAIIRKLRTVRKEALYARNVGISKNIARFIRAEGYDGWIGLCWDHPKILAEKQVPKEEEVETNAPKDISQWLKAMVAGGVNSVEGLVEAANEPKMLKLPAKPLPVFPTAEAAGLQCISPLSSDNSTLAASASSVSDTDNPTMLPMISL